MPPLQIVHLCMAVVGERAAGNAKTIYHKDTKSYENNQFNDSGCKVGGDMPYKYRTRRAVSLQVALFTNVKHK